MKFTCFLYLVILIGLLPTPVHGDSIPKSDDVITTTETESVGNTKTARPDGVPAVVHGKVGDISAGYGSILHLRNVARRQNFDWQDKSTLDQDIYSPKSVNFHPNGKKMYVNSLEGCRTVVYDVKVNGTLVKDKVIEHVFKEGASSLMSKPSGYYTFTHYLNGDKRDFRGKPVEGCFSHGGRWFWVPYYRRSFDINAQDPSAIAVIDTSTDSIIKLFETGPLPKMVAYGEKDGLIAVTHWGDNTVGLIDVSSANPSDWHHLPPLTAGTKLKLDFPLDESIDRDAHSGLKLRGTTFTPDGKYLLVSAMGGPLQVLDVKEKKYIGAVHSAYSVRHLVIDRGTLYGTCNVAGTAISVPLESVLKGIEEAQRTGSRNIAVTGWETCKVGGGARTLDVSPDGRFLFVACNSASEVCVVEAQSMKMVDRISVDSYPVGLGISPTGQYMAVTSQGRKGHGGNAVNVFEILRTDISLPEAVKASEDLPDSVLNAVADQNAKKSGDDGVISSNSFPKTALTLLGIIAILVIVRILIHIRRSRRQ